MIHTLTDMYHYREVIAKLVVDDPAYLPIFARLEKEIRVDEAEDPVAKARAMLRNKLVS